MNRTSKVRQTTSYWMKRILNEANWINCVENPDSLSIICFTVCDTCKVRFDIAVRSPSKHSRSVWFQQVSRLYLSKKKQYDKRNVIHSRIKNVGCNIFKNTSDGLKSYSISLTYLRLLRHAWLVRKNLRDARFKRTFSVMCDWNPLPPLCHPLNSRPIRNEGTFCLSKTSEFAAVFSVIKAHGYSPGGGGKATILTIYELLKTWIHGSRRLFLGLVCEIFNSVRQGEFERFQFHLFICILFFWRGYIL